VPSEPSNTPPGDLEENPGSLTQGVARHSFVYAAGILVSRAFSVLMLPIYTRYLTPADYGVLALVEMTLDFISILAGAKLALGLFRFYHKTESRREQDEVVSTSFLLVAGMYALVGGGTFLCAEFLSGLVFGSADNTILFQVAAMNVALGALLIVPLSLARVQDRSGMFVGLTLARLAVQVVLVIVFLVVMGLGVLGVFLATLVANALVGVTATVWLYRNVRLSWTRRASRDLVRYGFPLMATQVATFATTFSDRFFLQAVADESVVGLYNLAYQFGFILVMLGYAPIEQVWGPRRFRVAASRHADEVLSRGLLLISVLLLAMAVGISLFVHDLLRVMATPAFHAAAHVVPVILVAYVFQAWASIVDIGILMRERTRYVALANFIVAAVAIAGYFLFIPRYLEWGAAGVTLFAFLLQFLLIYHFSQKLWPVRYRWRPVLVLAGWSVIVAGIGILLPERALLSSITLRAGLGVAYLFGVWWLPILGEEDRESARRAVSAVVARIRR
jgi:O-antigen/teichoic acid export membrane protein